MIRSYREPLCRLYIAVVGTALHVALSAACFGAFAAVQDAQTTRIVSLVPNVTETLFAIGADDQIAAVSDFCKYPAAALAKPRVGGLLNPNLERIISERPTVVVILNSQDDLRRKLQKAGIRVTEVGSDSLEDVFASFRTLGALTGKTSASEELARSLHAQIDAVRARWSGKKPVPALIIVGRQPGALQNIYAAGSATYLGQLLEAAGGVNLAPSSTHPYVPISKEQIIHADPEVLIDASLGEAGENARVRESHKQAWQQLPTLKAVKQARICYLSDPHLTIPGPAMGQAAEKLAEILHGR